MRKNSRLTLVVCAMSCSIAVSVAQAQTNSAAPAGAAQGAAGGGGRGGFGGGGRGGAPAPWIEAGYDDHQNMMNQLGIKALRPGKSGNNQTGPGFDEATANNWMPTIPDALKMMDGTKVTTAEQWAIRRAEILEDFEREVYGRIPSHVPKVTWEVIRTDEGNVGGVPIISKTLVGHVDHSAFTNITVNIQASFSVPANALEPVPVLIQFGGFGGFGGGRGGEVGRGGTNGAGRANAAPGPGRGGFGGGGFGGGIPQQALGKGWGYGSINPGSIQADNGGNALRQGIIGLANKGQPRKPDDWGALRAWGWGVSRLIDYFEANPDSKVDPKKVGIEGVSRYGKAALVTEAFDPRVAVALVGSSGEGGAKLHRHDYGEAVENLTGSGEYHWMAGNFLQYGASDINGKSMNASDLPVDSHELIALCAPRPCFISDGSESGGDPKWIDHPGTYRAGILASPVYALLGKKGYGTDIQDWVHAPLPPVGSLVGGDLAFRQHEGGHTDGPNIPFFFQWVGNSIKAPPLPVNETATNQTPVEPYDPTAVGPGRPSAAADQPAPRSDANSQLAHAQLLEKAKKGGIDIYFVGDSITRRWGASDVQYQDLLANWNANFFGWNAADFGWGGDRVENILWRLENGELDGVNPKIIVVLAGINNVGSRPGDDAKIAGIAGGLKAILDVCRKKAPDATIIMTGIFPRNDNLAVVPEINRINEIIARFADGKKVRFLNVNEKLADNNGRLFDGMINPGDKLHPTVQGYQVWADGLKPMFIALLGPPANTDHAPPPTGDPSASGGPGTTSQLPAANSPAGR